MKTRCFIIVILLPFLGKTQLESYDLHGKEGVYTLEITSDTTYQLYFMHNWIESGYILWEQGLIKKKGANLILKTIDPNDATSVQEMILRPSKTKKKRKHYFENKEKYLEIERIKNKLFVQKVLKNDQ